MSEDNETIHGEFMRLDALRQNRLDASEKFAYYTIPSLFPPEDVSDSTRAVGMLDSIGASVVNHFANKLVTTLFSPNRPFFRLSPNAEEQKVKRIMAAAESDDQAASAAAKDQLSKLRTKFVSTEKAAVRYLERTAYRTSATMAAKLLIVTGDTVIRSKKGKRASVYSMRDYVCEKDLNGEDVLLIVRDPMRFGALTEEMQAQVQATAEQELQPRDEVTLYTRVEIESDGRYRITQAINDVDTASESVLPKKELPFIHLSWNLSRGENYGRGLVEDFGGSFHMIDTFTDFQARIGARIADTKILVDPQSGIDIEHLNTSNEDTYVAGRPGEVNNLSAGLDEGMQYFESIILMHKRQVSAAFLFQTGQTRDAERVTAQEIRENAAELEIAHGGVYSRMGSDWQTQVAYDCIAAIGEDLGDEFEPEIMTGMDSLSRTGEMQSIRYWMDDLSLLNNVPEDVRAWIKGGEFAQYAATQRGVEHGAFVKSKVEYSAEQKAIQDREDAVAQQQADAQGQLALQSAAAQKM